MNKKNINILLLVNNNSLRNFRLQFSLFEKYGITKNMFKFNYYKEYPLIGYGQFLEYLTLGKVKQVDLFNENQKAIVKIFNPKFKEGIQYIRVIIPKDTLHLLRQLKRYNSDFDIHSSDKSAFFLFIIHHFNSLFFVGIGLYLLVQNLETFKNNKEFSLFSSSEYSTCLDFKLKPKKKFNDVAGIDEAKSEFQEIVSFLKENKKYENIGAKIPKGLLLIGPSGTGKTLLAKAISNEANIPFFNTSGSEFVEVFAGVGAARVRSLFKKAAEVSPCIIFIDEIDTIGRTRGNTINNSNNEREQTLNQLLSEMDGFYENKNILVIGATNQLEILDHALLRPGRFDRQIILNLPNRLERIDILKVHSRNKSFCNDVSLMKIANQTIGFSGADLENLLNEAAILTTRYKKSKISIKEINQTLDRITIGIIKTPLENKKDKRLIAYHEVGHAVVASLVQSHNKVEKITLLPIGKLKGLTRFISTEDQTLLSRSNLLSSIITFLSGYIIEQIVFGDSGITTRSSNDLCQVTYLARQMVTKFGMSSLGPMALEDTSYSAIGPNFKSNFDYNEGISNRIDSEICKIVKFCENNARKILLDNRVIIDLIVEKLLEKETMTGNEFRKLLSIYTIIPN